MNQTKTVDAKLDEFESNLRLVEDFEILPSQNRKKTPENGSNSSIMGRPRKELDWELLDEYLYMQCTLEEVSERFNISPRTLRQRVKERYGASYQEYSEKKRKGGLVSLRRAQFKAALSGNVSMLIWLGKQFLGQKDKSEEERTPIVINADFFSSANESQ